MKPTIALAALFISACAGPPVGVPNHMTFSDFVWLHEQLGAGPPPPTDMCGEQGNSSDPQGDPACFYVDAA